MWTCFTRRPLSVARLAEDAWSPAGARPAAGRLSTDVRLAVNITEASFAHLARQSYDAHAQHNGQTTTNSDRCQTPTNRQRGKPSLANLFALGRLGGRGLQRWLGIARRRIPRRFIPAFSCAVRQLNFTGHFWKKISLSGSPDRSDWEADVQTERRRSAGKNRPAVTYDCTPANNTLTRRAAGPFGGLIHASHPPSAADLSLNISRCHRNVDSAATWLLV